MHFGKVWSDHSMLFCQFILSIYSVFHVICFCPIISWISCKPWTETYKCCVFSLIFISQIVKLFPSPRHFHGTSRIFPSLSIHFSVLLALLLHLFPLLPGQHRLCTAYLWHGTGEVQVTTAKTQLSHAIPCYLQSWFCFGAFWLNNVVLLVSLTVVSSNLSKLIISASAPLISVTSDVLLSAWAFKHLNISIEGHDASTRNWDANKPLTCLLIIACVVGDLFAKKILASVGVKHSPQKRSCRWKNIWEAYHRHKTQKANIDLPILTCKTESMSKLRRVLCWMDSKNIKEPWYSGLFFSLAAWSDHNLHCKFWQHKLRNALGVAICTELGHMTSS